MRAPATKDPIAVPTTGPVDKQPPAVLDKQVPDVPDVLGRDTSGNSQESTYKKWDVPRLNCRINLCKVYCERLCGGRGLVGQFELVFPQPKVRRMIQHHLWRVLPFVAGEILKRSAVQLDGVSRPIR